MLRGAQKQMIVVRTHGSRLFEEAYFVVRNGKNVPTACKEDMLWEANRIIEKSLSVASPIGGRREAGAAAPFGPAAGAQTVSRMERAEAAETVCGGDSIDPSFFSRRGVIRVLWFLIGAVCGGGAVGLLWTFL